MLFWYYYTALWVKKKKINFWTFSLFSAMVLSGLKVEIFVAHNENSAVLSFFF